MDKNNVVKRVLDIISSSHREAPAHFTSNGERTQCFCIDFEISESDEYELASEAWYQAKDPSMVKTGEDIMLAAYIAVKLGGEEHISELQETIINHNLQVVQDLKTQTQYLQHCVEYGKARAKLH